MTALPRQIQAEVDAAEALQAGLQQPPALAPEQPAVVVVPPIQEPQPEPLAPSPAPQLVAQPDPTQSAEYWRQRFDTMQGKYNAEVPRLHATLRETQDGMQQLRTQVAQLSTQRPPEQRPEPLVTAKDEEAFGTDLIGMVRRVTAEERRPLELRINQLEAYARSITPQVERVARVEQEVAQSREVVFHTELTRAVPDWQTINVDPRWHAWLSQVDPMAGGMRQLALDAASGSLDHERVAAIFNAFKQAAGIVAPTPAAPRPSGQAELARQVAPAKSSTATAAPSARPRYTGADYTHWTKPQRVHDTTKQKLDEMLSELERALHEGRIDW